MRRSGTFIDRKIRTSFKGKQIPSEKIKNNPVIDNLIAEGGENFFHYINWLGLANEPHMLVLSSTHHYYYDNNDFKGVTTLINLKKLNLIKHLDSFLRIICHLLSPKTNFIGCFTDKKTKNRDSVTSKMYKKVLNFLDSKTDVAIDKKDFTILLESHGFKLLDMTEIDGLTYFISQKNEKSAE